MPLLLSKFARKACRAQTATGVLSIGPPAVGAAIEGSAPSNGRAGFCCHTPTQALVTGRTATMRDMWPVGTATIAALVEVATPAADRSWSAASPSLTYAVLHVVAGSSDEQVARPYTKGRVAVVQHMQGAGVVAMRQLPGHTMRRLHTARIGIPDVSVGPRMGSLPQPARASRFRYLDLGPESFDERGRHHLSVLYIVWSN
jgi:hypothetical protein